MSQVIMRIEDANEAARFIALRAEAAQEIGFLGSGIHWRGICQAHDMGLINEETWEFCKQLRTALGSDHSF